MFEQAADRALDQEWRDRLQRAPHGEPWYSSLHVSQFPGDDPRWCPRALLYELMGHPPVEPASRDLMGTAIVGQAVEDWNLENVDLDGRLLSAPKSAQRQTGFEDADHWLTGSPDFVVLPAFTNRPHLIETKTKDRDVVIAMKMLQRSFDPGHARQTRGYLGIGSRVAHLAWPFVYVCKHTWRLEVPDHEREGLDHGEYPHVCRDHGIDNDCIIEIELQPMRTASLIYFARERPGQRQLTAEFLFEHDERWFQTGLARLEQVRQHFLADELPPQPFGGKEWSKLPCNWCVSPDSMVLCADLIWRRAGDIDVGQEIVGFDEHPAGRERTRYRRAVVESAGSVQRPRVLVRTSLGETTVSAEHRFLVIQRTSRQHRQWKSAEDLVAGDQIIAFGRPWKTDQSWAGGWLAGLFDGEGSVVRGHLSVAQSPGAVLDKAKEILCEREVAFGEFEKVNGEAALGRSCSRLHVSGLYEQLKLLGSIRPLRLLGKAPLLWEGTATWSKSSIRAVVSEIERLDEGSVIALGTTTQTLITDGLFSHNCKLKKNSCKPDHVAGVTKLTESAGNDFAHEVYGIYEPDMVHEAVLHRWRGKSGMRVKKHDQDENVHKEESRV